MPPIRVTHIEDDETLEGYYVEWFDESNLDGLPLSGVFHLTVGQLDELGLHQLRPNGAPEDKLMELRSRVDGVRGIASPPSLLRQLGEEFADAYGVVVADRIDRHRLGLRAVTADGHADLVAVRAGAPVRPHNAVAGSGVKEFVQRRRVQ